MSEPNSYREFMKELKRHWKAELPEVRPLTERCGSLAKASSFYAGVTHDPLVHVYICFQAHKNVGGQFTINVVLTRDEFNPRDYLQRDDQRVFGLFKEGPNRIGGFVKARQGDKWWHLKQDKDYEEFCRKNGYEFKFPDDYWRPANYDDQEEVVRNAVLDVTRDVRSTLEQLRAPPPVGE